MSEGPIKRWRDSWKPPKASTTDAERVCHFGGGFRAYCGRKPRAGTLSWSDVTCSDCLAAARADGLTSASRETPNE